MIRGPFFFVLIGFFGLLLHCSSFNNDPRMAGCQNCVYCFPASMEACFGLVIVLVEYVVEDLHGRYTPPKLDREHMQRLKMLKLL
ncbi:hypothetical protein HanPI659440_Chr07g0271421 [Helianthus annuus]|nr:hypothetical protein HanPI659440_Chr07g0271421 [Helianthus annuus]